MAIFFSIIGIGKGWQGLFYFRGRTVFWLVKSTVPTAMLNGAKSFTVLKTLILCRVVQNCYVVYIFCKIYS